MGLILEVKGKTANFSIEDYEVRGYEFKYSVPDSKYAKGHKDNRELIIKGSISRTLEKDRENKTDIMNQIRNWAKTEYTDPSYYSYVKVTHFHADEIIRAITFPDAFIKNYQEDIDPHTGDGIYTITLLQKPDKRINIIIDPFNQTHPSLSTLTKAAIERREEAQTQQALAIAPMVLSYQQAVPTPDPDGGPIPRWIQEMRLLPASGNAINRTVTAETELLNASGTSLRPPVPLEIGTRVTLVDPIHRITAMVRLANPIHGSTIGRITLVEVSDWGNPVYAFVTRGNEMISVMTTERMEANVAFIYNFLSGQGWTRNAIAGLLGNMHKESHFNPGAWENRDSIDGETLGRTGVYDDGRRTSQWSTSGYGLLQWTPSGGTVLRDRGNNRREMSRWADNLAVNNPRQLMIYQLEYMLSSFRTQPDGSNNWLNLDTAQAIIRFFSPPDGAPQAITFPEYISSTHSAGDLAILMHAMYVRSNDHNQHNGRERIQRRIDDANRWYNFISQL